MFFHVVKKLLLAYLYALPNGECEIGVRASPVWQAKLELQFSCLSWTALNLN